MKLGFAYRIALKLIAVSDMEIAFGSFDNVSADVSPIAGAAVGERSYWSRERF